MSLANRLAAHLDIWPVDGITEIWVSCGSEGDFVTRAQWQSARDALDIWTGEGPPPVGTMVEIHKNGYGIRESAEAFMGIPVEVCAAFTTGEGVAMIAVYGGIDLGCEVFCADMARPVRTPEQIAAEEREKEVDRMVATVSMLDKGWARKVCYSLYDANYRKQES